MISWKAQTFSLWDVSSFSDGPSAVLIIDAVVTIYYQSCGE